VAIGGDKLKTCVGAILLLATAFAAPLQGDEGTTEPAGPPKELPDLLRLDARRAVREGNRLLLEGKADVALDAYDYARKLRPEAREIAFNQGLAHYEQREFEQAREAFREVSASGDDALGHDALYSQGVCDHTEGLESVEQDPKLAMSLLENAMTRYHDVLEKQPDHKAAHDANRKAAMMWRELKRQLQEQQQQESDGECDNPQDGEKQESQKDQQKQGEQEQQQSQPSDPEEQQEEEQQQEPAQQQQQQQQEDQQEQQASAAKQHEQASREQAERKLREMMQAQRQREKMRRQPLQRIPVSPVDKDW